MAHGQAGALPKRSAIDLVMTVTNIIEDALIHGQSVAVLLPDVKGAFDVVFPSTLANRISLQGWSPWLQDWVGSFLRNRTITVHHDGSHSPPRAVPHAGLPQGSPTSPILFLLYPEHLLRVKGATARAGYADDVNSL